MKIRLTVLNMWCLKTCFTSKLRKFNMFKSFQLVIFYLTTGRNGRDGQKGNSCLSVVKKCVVLYLVILYGTSNKIPLSKKYGS